MAAKKIECISYIIIGGAPPVRFDSLTPEKRAECVTKMCTNIGKTHSGYLSNKPQEAAQLLSKANS